MSNRTEKAERHLSGIRDTGADAVGWIIAGHHDEPLLCIVLMDQMEDAQDEYCYAMDELHRSPTPHKAVWMVNLLKALFDKYGYARTMARKAPHFWDGFNEMLAAHGITLQNTAGQ